MSENGLDLTKIQSIPIIDQPWNYAFFIDVLFDNLQDYRNTLVQIVERGITVKILGEYTNQKL